MDYLCWMNEKWLLLFCLILLSCGGKDVQGYDQVGDRLFDGGWKFLKGDIAGAEQPTFDDSDWRELTIPHDWAIEPHLTQDEYHIGPFVKGIKDSTSTGNIAGGVGWYRKHFTLERSAGGKTVLLHFDGVSVESDVWINGHHLGFHPNGYTPFYYDLTPYLKPAGRENIVAVKTMNSGDNSRWYTGAGLYRHIRLSVSRPVHIEPWSVFVTTPEVAPEQSKVEVALSVKNETDKESDVVIYTTLIHPDGHSIDSSEFRSACPAGARLDRVIHFSIEQPSLWSPDSPFLYTAEIRVEADGIPSDTERVRFGIRSISFSAGKRFLLNGKETLLKGACIHHDNGLLGSATFDRAEIRKIELLKKNGFNAIRTAHNLPSTQVLDACDSIGMLVIDEAFDMWVYPKRENDYHLYFEEWSDRDIASMVLRDRNHPSVIAWSIGNEIYERADSSGLAIAGRLVDVVKSLDKTRPVTQAICALWQIPSQKWDATIPAFALLDIGSYNYEWKHYERDHALHPERVITGTESFPMEAHINWQMAVEKPYVTGDFVWTGMDYIGEVGIGNTRYGNPGEKAVPVRPWPWYLAWCGDLDICGNKKPQSHYRDVVWGASDLEILVHAPVPEGKTELISKWGWPDEYPHWNWTGHETVPLQVSVYTSCDEVALFLNDKQLGKEKVNPSDLTVRFRVPYQAGELKAVGYKEGKNVLSKALVTSGKAFQIKLIPERHSIHPDANDLAYIQIELTDDNGRPVPDKEVLLHISVEGDGRLLASGNASPYDIESFNNPICKTFRGKALAILQSNGKPGKVSLIVHAEGLPEAKTEIEIR